MPDSYVCPTCYRKDADITECLGYRCENCLKDFAFYPKHTTDSIVTCPYCSFKQYFGATKARTGKIEVEEEITYEKSIQKLKNHFTSCGFENAEERAKNTIGSRLVFENRMKARKKSHAG